MTIARSWATYVECKTCGAKENEPCKKAKSGESYRGLYMHRDRVSRAVNQALEVECPKCGNPETVPCYFRTEVVAETESAAILAIGSKLKVHEERAKAARNKRKEERRMSVKRDAEAVVKAVRNSDWTRISGGAYAATGAFTLLKPDTDSHGHSATYVVHQPSGRLFRSVTRGSNSLTSCALRNTVHSKWLTDAAGVVPGGAALLAREPGRTSNVGTVVAEQPAPTTPEPEPVTEPEPAATEIVMSSPSFLTPTTRTKRMIVEERTNTLDLTLHDLTRLLTAAGVKVSPKRVKLIDQTGRDVTGTLRLEWTETSEREESE